MLARRECLNGESQLGLVNCSAVARAAVIAWLLSAVGCATEPPPTNATGWDTPIAVDFTSEALSPWNDMPMGTYRVPSSQTLVSGFEKGSPLAIALGVVGGVQVVGFRVAEDADWFAFQAKVPSTSLLAGVNVMDANGHRSLTVRRRARQTTPTSP